MSIYRICQEAIDKYMINYGIAPYHLLVPDLYRDKFDYSPTLHFNGIPLIFVNYTESLVEAVGQRGNFIVSLPRHPLFDSYSTYQNYLPKCECGAEKVGHSRHSNWCPKH